MNVTRLINILQWKNECLCDHFCTDSLILASTYVVRFLNDYKIAIIIVTLWKSLTTLGKVELVIIFPSHAINLLILLTFFDVYLLCVHRSGGIIPLQRSNYTAAGYHAYTWYDHTILKVSALCWGIKILVWVLRS